MHDAVTRLRPGPIDIHAHIMPERLVSRLAAGERPGFRVDVDDEGRSWVRLGEGGPRMPLPAGMTDLPLRLKTMEEQGVAAQLLSPWIALAAYHLGPEDAVWFARALNEEIAAVVRETPDRFVGIGSVPLQVPDSAPDMLRWMVRDLGLLGVEIATKVGNDRLLDDPSLEPFWAAADELGAFVLIHPTLGGGDRPEFAPYYLTNLIHNPLETTFAAAHLIFSGVMERYPRAKVCLVHGGGFLPYNVGRLRRGRLVRPETQGAMTGDVDQSYGRFFFDTVTHSVTALRFLVGEVGADRVLLGSDYPFDMADPMPVGTVREAAFVRAEESAILRRNAERILTAGAA
jgi:aminocarboxymuconate-semialdehyde decarboxylase